MRKKKSTKPSNVLGFALFIGALMLTLILIGVSIKIFLLFQHSSFDGKHQFVLEINEPSQTRFVVFSPFDNSLRTVIIYPQVNNGEKLTLGFPIDGKVNINSDVSSFSGLSYQLIFERNSLKPSTTILDGIRFLIFIYTIDQSKNFYAKMPLSSNFTSDGEIKFSRILKDPQIYKEGKSISIINGTGISGLGSKVARLLNHIGGNVVSVTTADTASPKSWIGYNDDSSYTLSRFSTILRLPILHLGSPAISDMTITLGTDFKGD